MRRLASALAALAFAASLSTGAVAKPNDHMRGNSMYAPGHMKRMCPPGRHWVKAHRRRNGTWVQGYCR